MSDPVLKQNKGDMSCRAREGLPFPCEVSGISGQVSTASRSWCFRSPTAEAQPVLPTQLYSVSTLPDGPLPSCGIFTFGLGKILSNPPGHRDTGPAASPKTLSHFCFPFFLRVPDVSL